MLKKAASFVLAALRGSTYRVWEKRLSRQARGGRVRRARLAFSLAPVLPGRGASWRQGWAGKKVAFF
ncbi:MAG: hypothetical protein K0S45_1471 [Nitrospira sp.]|jgi:hypothetical protein|nr:hypothetical protein [Nitrospira sp.]